MPQSPSGFCTARTETKAARRTMHPAIHHLCHCEIGRATLAVGVGENGDRIIAAIFRGRLPDVYSIVYTHAVQCASTLPLLVDFHLAF
ncbi:hypothetical protein BAE44_0011025 [Dichanthelium oligosanthes]|uniref:Uncharacterized protein n=1 Tax=Dichanthelium oligosanthes TaxID=888268 RepID=A0A1E5VS63_9POAL|nr:hypothetical protein BAE44_0011025 [Dichanthelium oligosanthes]